MLASSSRLFGSNKNSRPTYRARQKLKNEDLGDRVTDLDWEHYEFGINPKMDGRFSEINNEVLHADEETYGKIVKKEAKEDEQMQEQLADLNDAYRNLEPSLVKQATSVLQPYINADRTLRIQEVLSKRTKNVKFAFENPANPSNVWACLRTIDSFGVQNVDIIMDPSAYTGSKQTTLQKRGMRTAMGSAKWLTLTQHSSTKEAVECLQKEEGYKVYATDVNSESRDIRDIDFPDGEKICIVMGNEDRGISDEMRNLADETFYLPMVGFAESFNLSVATSITLAHLSAKTSNSKDGKGPLQPGDLSSHEYNCLYLKGLLQSLAQRKMGPLLLKKEGIKLPECIYKL